MIESDFKRSRCPVANMLDILGDKWTLLIIRDLYFGKTTFTELQNSQEKVPSNILAQRLKHLLAEEIIQKQQYQTRPIRYNYSLTNKGHDLEAVMRAMLVWGNKHIAGTYNIQQIKAYRQRVRASKLVPGN